MTELYSVAPIDAVDQQQNKEISELTTRIALMEKQNELLTQLLTKLEDTIPQLDRLIQSVQQTLALQDQRLLAQENGTTAQQSVNKEFLDRIASLERWKWMIMGGAGLAGFLSSKIPLGTLLGAISAGIIAILL